MVWDIIVAIGEPMSTNSAFLRNLVNGLLREGPLLGRLDHRKEQRPGN